ncbi:MAG: pyridoxal 5'-phosphate synthase glutaminase subunit PdxT [Candidatus Promineifilaceae bacterium]|nr:pyridoxal 5'-phosphate synthase glutaminase subunit PdxT [Candidatus Promineifilaceae bacterium]
MRIGVLALQGAFREHVQILRDLGVEAIEVRLPEQLEGLDGLIIPGGESTTIGKLAENYGLLEPLQRFARQRPVWGTCAGMILMAKDIGRAQPLLALMDIEVERNAFGRQVDSFETELDIAALDQDASVPFPAIFIRGPRLVSTDEEAGVQVLARLEDGTAVAARQGHWLVTSFHPELSDDPRFHRYFLEMVSDPEETAPAPVAQAE